MNVLDRLKIRYINHVLKELYLYPLRYDNAYIHLCYSSEENDFPILGLCKVMITNEDCSFELIGDFSSSPWGIKLGVLDHIHIKNSDICIFKNSKQSLFMHNNHIFTFASCDTKNPSKIVPD